MSSFLPTSYCVADTVLTDNGRVVQVNLTGEVDADARDLLDDTISRVASSTARSVMVDLGGVSFAGATLPNFLARLHHASPHAAIVVCRPSPMTRLILHITDIDTIATIEDRPVR